MVETIKLVLTLIAAVGIVLAIPLLLRIKTLLLELLQSIVGKVEDNEPFIHGLPPEAETPADFIAETVIETEVAGLDNGTFRGHVPWEPPPDEMKT